MVARVAVMSVAMETPLMLKLLVLSIAPNVMAL
jgi:hypothetical protein